MIGRVVATKMQKTVTVLVETPKVHAMYHKRFMRSKKFLVDDPMGVKVGQIVEFIKIRPISKRKHWQITKVLGIDLIALGTEALKVDAAEAIAEVLPEEEKVEEQMPVAEETKEEKTEKVAKKPAKKAKKQKEEEAE